VLDIGTGCGIIPIYLAKKGYKNHIVGIEIQDDLYELALKNRLINDCDSVDFLRGDVKEMTQDLKKTPFNVVVSNPPFTAKTMGLPHEIAPNSAVISAIGVALALVRDTIEKTVVTPTEKDILDIRKEAEEAVVRMGAAPETVEVQIEIDAQKSILRASATGTTELRTRDLAKSALSDEELAAKVRQSVRGEVESFERVAEIGNLIVFRAVTVMKRLGGLMRRRDSQLRVIDREGIIRLQLRRGDCLAGTKSSVLGGLKEFFEKHTVYGDAGREFPDVFLLFRGRILDLSGLMNIDQILSLAQVETAAVGSSEPMAALIKYL
ncbi:MAG: methyltransferase, partial [Candidatus Sumerlaeaceae bacterium]|nr:methyltransferase [Candidatus Sumerlaeaceae bacterium]